MAKSLRFLSVALNSLNKPSRRTKDASPGVGRSDGGAAGTDLEWAYHPLGTPGLPGENRIGTPGFVSSPPFKVITPHHVPCALKDAFGEYEAFVTKGGTVTTVTSYREPFDGDACERKYIFPAIRRWRFTPATIEGTPTPVYMWVGVNIP